MFHLPIRTSTASVRRTLFPFRTGRALRSFALGSVLFLGTPALPLWAAPAAADTAPATDSVRIPAPAVAGTPARSEPSLPFPWTGRAAPLAKDATEQTPEKDIQGEWISSKDEKRVLDIREDRFSLQGTGENLRGRVVQVGPELLFTREGGSGGGASSCLVLWQALGDGRLSLNGGEDILHRRGDPAIPPTRVAVYGSPHCRFSVTLPSILPVEEVEEGVRVSTVERDAAMQILSGTTELSAHDFAKAVADRLGSTDLFTVDGNDNAWAFTCTVRGVPTMQYVIKEGEQYLYVSLMGDFGKLAGYLRHVKIVQDEEEEK